MKMSIVLNTRAAAVAVAFFGFSLASFAAAPSFDAVYVFGDSDCDVGNIFIATGGAVPAAPYYRGRFSNGPIWVDHIAGTYGLALQPSLAGGTDYAFGGAKVTAAVPEGPGLSIPSVLQQIELYLSQHGGKADPKALYIVEGGGNDILDATGGSATTLGDEIAVGLAVNVELLEHAGARNILVPNLVDVGQLPSVKATGATAEAFATAATQATNQALDFLLRPESMKAAIRLYRIDTYSLFQSILTDTNHYGFTDVTDPCLTTATCNPYTFLFWDGEHFTLFGHSLVAVLAEQLLKQ
jgi:phospholipase/lecithinase/hemolysin